MENIPAFFVKRIMFNIPLKFLQPEFSFDDYFIADPISLILYKIFLTYKFMLDNTFLVY